MVGGHTAKSNLVEEKCELAPSAGGAVAALTVPRASESALLSRVTKRKAKVGDVNGGGAGLSVDAGAEEEEEDPMEHNMRQIYASRHNPIWLHSKHKVPEYVLNGAVLGKVPFAQKPAQDPDEEWGSVPKPYVRTHVSEVQPWVMPEVKKALSKQGMQAQVCLLI